MRPPRVIAELGIAIQEQSARPRRPICQMADIARLAASQARRRLFQTDRPRLQGMMIAGQGAGNLALRLGGTPAGARRTGQAAIRRAGSACGTAWPDRLPATHPARST